jgi:hypothetical protein
MLLGSACHADSEHGCPGLTVARLGPYPISTWRPRPGWWRSSGHMGGPSCALNTWLQVLIRQTMTCPPRASRSKIARIQASERRLGFRQDTIQRIDILHGILLLAEEVHDVEAPFQKWRFLSSCNVLSGTTKDENMSSCRVGDPAHHAPITDRRRATGASVFELVNMFLGTPRGTKMHIRSRWITIQRCRKEPRIVIRRKRAYLRSSLGADYPCRLGQRRVIHCLQVQPMLLACLVLEVELFQNPGEPGIYPIQSL